MKKTIYIAFAAFALLSFASCQKENDISASQKSGMRTVTVAFDSNLTKTTPSVGQDKTTPQWAVGDVIRILDASNTAEEATHYEDITLTADMISSDRTVASFTTILKGTTLYAVYPKSATTMTSCNGDVTFKISEEQDGSFANANICVAKANNGNLILSNVTAVMEFTQTASITAVKRVQVRAANPISGTLTATFGEDNKVNGVSWDTSGAGAHTIVATTPSDAQDTYYIAVAPVATGAIEFKYNKGLDAYPNNVAVFADKAGRTLEKNIIYRGSNLSMDGKVYGIDYVNISAKYDGANATPLKWAVENLAISLSGKKAWKGAGDKSLWHVVGDYFQWGAHAGYCGQNSDSDKGLLIYNSFKNTRCGDSGDDGFTFKSVVEGKDYWFYILDGSSNKAVSPHLLESSGVWKETGYSYPYPPYDAFAKYKKYDKNVSGNLDYTSLLKDDDVANIIYGVDWRMPKSSEFLALKEATFWAWDAVDMGYYVFSPIEGKYDAGGIAKDDVPDGLYKVDALLFFPAAGYADTDADQESASFPGGTPYLGLAGACGDYWSSSLADANYTEADGIKHHNAALGLDISPDGVIPDYDLNRYLGCSVRPVGVVTANNPDPTETDPEETVL